MPWPTVAVPTTGMDADTDTLPRTDILDLTTKFNQAIAMRGVADGVCDLDGSGKVPTARLEAKLAAIAGLVGAADKGVHFTGAGSAAVHTQTAYARQLLDDADAPAAQVTLAIASTKRTFTAQQTPKAGALTDAASITWDGDSNGQIVGVTLGATRAMAAPTNIVQNTAYLIRIAQDATGTRLLTWDTAYKFGTTGAPTLSTGASKVDFVSFVGGASNTLECLGVRLDAVT